MKSLTLPIAIVATFALGQAAVAKPLTGSQYLSQAKVNLNAARSIALKARAGRITDQELEKEAGGTGLRYSFDIVTAGKTFEVGVDARTGKVLENGAEGAHPD
jgi:uncharacterized membrane protein YkoI